MEWFTARNRQKLGPFSWSQLQAQAATGALAAGDMILQEGACKWVTAGSVPGLFAESGNTCAAGTAPKTLQAQEPPVDGLQPPTVSYSQAGVLPQRDPTWPRIAGFHILGELCRGGMEIVYRPQQSQLKRVVALKMVLAGAHAEAKDLAFQRAEAATRVSSPGCALSCA